MTFSRSRKLGLRIKTLQTVYSPLMGDIRCSVVTVSTDLVGEYASSYLAKLRHTLRPRNSTSRSMAVTSFVWIFFRQVTVLLFATVLLLPGWRQLVVYFGIYNYARQAVAGPIM